MRDKPSFKKIDEVKGQSVEGAHGAEIQVLLGPEDGVPNFFTRRFTIEPGGRVPLHRHDAIEHEQVMLEGEMVVVFEDGSEKTVHAGEVIYFPAMVAHGYENRGEKAVVFLCMVPRTENYQTEWL